MVLARMQKPSEMYVTSRMQNIVQIRAWNACFATKLHFSLNIMLRVSFSPGRDRACRHYWISSFWPPRENGRYSFRFVFMLLSCWPLFKLPGRFFVTPSIKIIENHQKCAFFQFVRPLAGDFCWPRGWGWGGRGEPFRTILVPQKCFQNSKFQQIRKNPRYLFKYAHIYRKWHWSS